MPTEKVMWGEILADWFLAGDWDRMEKRYKLVARGAWPKVVRELIIECGRHILLEEDPGPERKRAAELMICYAWWAEAVQLGIARRHLEYFILDHLALLREDPSQTTPHPRWLKYRLHMGYKPTGGPDQQSPAPAAAEDHRNGSGPEIDLRD